MIGFVYYYEMTTWSHKQARNVTEFDMYLHKGDM
jgi:hypothetical protein